MDSAQHDDDDVEEGEEENKKKTKKEKEDDADTVVDMHYDSDRFTSCFETNTLHRSTNLDTSLQSQRFVRRPSFLVVVQD